MGWGVPSSRSMGQCAHLQGSGFGSQLRSWTGAGPEQKSGGLAPHFQGQGSLERVESGEGGHAGDLLSPLR